MPRPQTATKDSLSYAAAVILRSTAANVREILGEKRHEQFARMLAEIELVSGFEHFGSVFTSAERARFVAAILREAADFQERSLGQDGPEPANGAASKNQGERDQADHASQKPLTRRARRTKISRDLTHAD